MEEQGEGHKDSTQMGKRFSYLPYVVKAVIISEDDKFWSHKGFDLDAMEKALEKDIEQGMFKFGGSTISQQLVKNLYLSPSKSPSRKLAEAVITWRMERTLSKRRILELYLNVAEWGEGLFGVDAASWPTSGNPPRPLALRRRPGSPRCSPTRGGTRRTVRPPSWRGGPG